MKIFTMTRIVSWNLLSGPATLMYPLKKRVCPAITRGRIENAIESCIFCGLCGKRCPTSAITVARQDREWQIDRLRCCVCNLCVEICPTKCLSTHNDYAPPVTAREMAIHRQSSPRPPAAGKGEAQPDDRGEA